MGREDQIEEREVLDSIFPDEITDISPSEFRIRITLDIEDDEPENPQPTMVLTVRYPDDYPDKAPNLDLSALEDGGGEKHPLFNVAEDKTALLATLDPVIEENMGMAMVFTLVTTLKEEAEQLVARRRADIAAAHQEVLLAAEREENKKFHGTMVSRETFLQWRDGFMREMEEERMREEEERAAEMKKARIKDPAKMSGRQLWESGLAKGEEIEEGEDDAAAPIDEMEKLKVAAS
ncbi:RWD domain-domain-containing protein [Coniella lustricola]|uniref:RWD domain-domain-containing protein n=1 Tax=Coniella lustricola TaxID=2025994 RepID=A0A2T3AIP5_9PEZI|nr:RWD domain-domain-containing protein [Coniella lustricola]